VPLSKQASVKAGARADLVQTDSHNRFITSNVPFSPFNLNNTVNFNPIIFSVNPIDQNLQQTFDLWSAYVNGEYKFDNHLTALTGFGYAQRPPTLTELYADGPFLGLLQPGLDRMIGDPHIQPEQNYQFDVGLRADYGWFRGGVNGFYAYIHDYITFDLNSSIQQAQNGLGVYTFRNTDWASLAGGELFGETDVTEWLTPFGSMNYVQGRDLTHTSNSGPANLQSSRRSIDQEPLPGIFPLEARTGFRLHEARKSPRWSTELALRMVAGQDLVATSLGELPTPGFTIWDLRGFWQANESLLLTAGVLNIGDKFYREHLDPRAGNQMFQPGTNFYFGVQWQY
jgi:outer membrane receptor protein involved in Fe transport